MNNEKTTLVIESAGKKFEYEVVYFWYDHLLFRFGEGERVSKLIQDGDYEAFMKYYLRYGREFFPQTATVFSGSEIIGSIDIDNPAGFALITYNEYECG